MSKMPRTSALKTYRRRVHASRCKGLRKKTCRKVPGCSYARGSKRHFCRKSGNKHRRHAKISVKRRFFL